MIDPEDYFDLAAEDATAWLESQDPRSLDLIITDPAYASLEKHRAVGTTTRLKVSDGSSNEWFPVVENTYYPAFFRACHRALVKDAHLYVHCDAETSPIVRAAAASAGFKWWNDVVWDKGRIGMGYHYRKRHELIAMFEKGKRRLRDLGVADVLPCPMVTKGYPTEKPWRLEAVFVAQSSSVGQLVADPFFGSASVGEASLRLGRRFVGSDVSQRAMVHGANRLTRVMSRVQLEPGDATDRIATRMAWEKENYEEK